VGYVLGFGVMLLLLGWQGHPIKQGPGALPAALPALATTGLKP